MRKYDNDVAESGRGDFKNEDVKILTVGYALPSSGIIHQSGVVYGTGGVIRTLTAVDWKRPPLIYVQQKDDEHGS